MYNIKNYEDTENRILGKLLRAPLESRSMRQIALDTNLSYVTVYKLTSILGKKRLIKCEKKGKSCLVSVDFENAELSRLSSAMIYERSVFTRMHPKIKILSGEIEDKLAGKFYILILFGSYAKGTSKMESDIDLLFVIPSRQDIENYREKINKALKLHPAVKKDFSVVAVKDFIEMLDQKYTVGREAFLHCIVLFGAEQYYNSIKGHVRTKGY
jgi:predicted nucleotidyltransferase